jgi:hypothetical protein
MNIRIEFKVRGSKGTPAEIAVTWQAKLIITYLPCFLLLFLPALLTRWG